MTLHDLTHGNDDFDAAQQERLRLACDAAKALSGSTLQQFQQGSKLLCAGQYEAALEIFNPLTQTAYQYWGTWYQRAVILQELGHYEDAIASYQATLRWHPPATVVAEVWYQQADALHYGLGDYPAAIAAYDQVIAQDPQHTLAWLHRGNAQLYGLHQPYTAIGSYNHVLAIDPDQDWLWYNRGNALVELGFHHAAVNNYDRALSLNPHHGLVKSARQAALDHIQAQVLPTNMSIEDLSIEDWQQLAILPTVPQDEDLAAEERAYTATHIQHDTMIQRERGIAPNLHTPTATATLTRQEAYVVIQDSQGLRRLLMTGDRLTVGRSPDCDLRLYSKFASRCHAVINRVPTPGLTAATPRYRLQDGDEAGNPSTNGLTINGQKLRDRLLENGDLVHFGPKVWLRYFLVDVTAEVNPD